MIRDERIHRMKMFKKLMQRGVSEKRLLRAKKALFNVIGEEVAPEEPDRTQAAPRRAL